MNKIAISILAILLIIFYSCSSTKHLQKGQYAINNVKIEIIGDNNLSSSAFHKFLYTKPMRKTLFIIPLHAWIYNIPNSKKIHSREQKKQKKLAKINARRIKKYDQKTYKYIKKRIKYKKLWQRYIQAADSAKALKFYQKYIEYDKKVKDRQRDYALKIEAIKKKDIFMFSDIFYKFGEKPQTYDTTAVIKTVKQFKLYLNKKGYYHPKIKVIVKKYRKKSDIIYKIYPGIPHIIANVKYNFPNDTLKKLISENPKMRIKVGNILDLDYLNKYRKKLADFLKNNGYYFFIKDYISYTIDTIGKPFKAYITVNFYKMKNKNNLIYKPWKIKNIYIFSDYNSTEALQNPYYFKNFDTIPLSSRLGYEYFFVRKSEFIVKPQRIMNELYIYPNTLYNFSSVKKTYRHLSKFKIYKLINIQFNPIDSQKHYLNCNITLNPTKKQSITTEIEGTNNSGNLGIALNLKYTHRNVFHGGEILQLKAQTAIERQTSFSNTSKYANFNTQTYSFDVKLTLPRLLTIFKQSAFIARSNPKTIITGSFIYENRPEYIRTIALTNLDYYWKSSPFMSNYLTIVRINYVKVFSIADFFRNWIETNLLKESYENHFITGAKYNIILSNQGQKGNNYYINFNFGFSGIGLYYFYKKILKDTARTITLPGFDIPFSQFIKTDADIRYYIKRNGNTLIFRQFIGVAVPFGNSRLIPSGEQYFAGGANDIRAWQVRALGPGSYKLPENIPYPNELGDIKIETNSEYRFILYKFLEGAFFFDVGNIWSINKKDTRPEAIFQWNRFYKELAVGTGIGLRLNFKFIVLRADLGMKLRDPTLPESRRWIPLERKYTKNDFTFNIAIGYPF